jgi:hypothetical protein
VKFLVIWKIELSLLSPHVASAVARMQACAKPPAPWSARTTSSASSPPTSR